MLTIAFLFATIRAKSNKFVYIVVPRALCKSVIHGVMYVQSFAVFFAHTAFPTVALEHAKS